MKIWIILVGALVGCSQATNQSSLSANEAKSEDSRTYTVPIYTRLPDCTKAENTDPRFPITNVYLESIAKSITQSNSDVFKGFYAPGDICIVLSNKSWAASTDQRLPLIQINPRFLMSYKNDVEVAADIAHELGHVVTLSGARVLEPRLAKNKEYVELVALKSKMEEDFYYALVEKLEQILPDLSATEDSKLLTLIKNEIITDAYLLGLRKDDPLSKKYWDPSKRQTLPPPGNEEILKLLRDHFEAKKINVPQALVDLETKQKESVKSYDSIESRRKKLADEVIGKDMDETNDEVIADVSGYNFFLKAGWKSSEFIRFTLRDKWGVGAEQFDSPADCVRAIESGTIPIRARKDQMFSTGHTSQCWRIYNMQYVELNYYKQNHPELLKGTRVKLDNGPSLEDVQAEIRRVLNIEPEKK